MVLPVLVVGCDRDGHEIVEPEPLALEVPEVLQKPPGVESPDEPEEFVPIPVDFSTWPGREEYMTFELMWLGGDEEVALHEEPRKESEVVAQLRWFDGDQLDWAETNVHVDSPRAYRVGEPQVITGIPYDVEFRELEADQREFEVGVDETLYLYQYAGEGTCYLGVAEEIVLADCPTGEVEIEDDGDSRVDGQWRPISQSWWVRVTGGDSDQGWLLVDDAPVEVHPRKIEGFDHTDDFDENIPY